MRKLILTLALASAALPATAADLIIDTPVAYTDAGFDWNGFYAGLVGGYGTGNTRAVRDTSGAVNDVPLNGGLLGVALGANMQHDAFVLGVEGEVLWSGMTGSAICAGAPAYNCNASVEWLGSVRGRAGVAMDSVLLFASGGIAAAGGRGTVTPAAPGITNTFSDTYFGWTLGAGVEMAVSDTMSVKAEYSYYNLGSRTAPVGTLHSTESMTVSPVVHAVKLGLNVHF